VNIEGRHIRLEIQQRGAVNDIHVFNVEAAVNDPNEPHDGQSYGIGAFGGSGGEHSVRLVVEKRLDLERITFAEMKMVEQNQMGKPLQVFQPGCVLECKFHRSRDTPCCQRLNGHALDVAERGTNNPNGQVGDPLHSLCPLKSLRKSGILHSCTLQPFT